MNYLYSSLSELDLSVSCTEVTTIKKHNNYINCYIVIPSEVLLESCSKGPSAIPRNKSSISIGCHNNYFISL